MCTRFHVESQSFPGFIERAQRTVLANDFMAKLGKNLSMSGEIRPTDVAAVLAPNKDGKMAVFPMLWGFTHESAAAPVVNCRLETADQKDMWKDSWFRRRCVIPASWYYEWEHFASPDRSKKKTGAKYAIQPKGASVTWIAGLYRFEDRGGLLVPVFSVITRWACGELKALHDRMPLILDKESVVDWIKPDGNPGEVAGNAVTEMMFEKC